MKADPDWSDLACFAAIARAGALAPAARQHGVSTATLSRRMKAFEASLGRRLFLHGADGYALTEDGRALAERIRGMEASARQITTWRDAAHGPIRVRISAGTWTALDLARQVSRYWDRQATWVPEFIYCDRDLDIARREVDIGIRNRRPEQPWVARQQIGWVEYAVFAVDDGVKGWIGPSWDAPTTPTLRWIAAHHDAAIVTRANSPQLAAALAASGAGRIVLPIFAGASLEGLSQISDPIAELRSPQWLVSHHDARNEPAIRAALDAIAGYLAARPSAS